MNSKEKEALGDEILTASETAKLLGTTRQNIHALVKKGRYKPFRYIIQTGRKGDVRMPLFLKSEVLNAKREEFLIERMFCEEYIISSFAKHIMRKRLSDFIEDLENGVIKEEKGLYNKSNQKAYIDLKKFTSYAKKYGIDLQNLITGKGAVYLLQDKGISDSLNNFLKKYQVRPAFHYKGNISYTLIDRDVFQSAINRELEEREKGVKT